MRRQERTKRQTVHAHNGYILRNPLASFPQSTNGTNGHNIRTGKHRCEFTACLQQGLDGIVAVLIGIANALVIPLRVKGDVIGQESPAAALVTQAAGIRNFPVAADDGDTPVTQTD